jgi:hypothetical protein
MRSWIKLTPVLLSTASAAAVAKLVTSPPAPVPAPAPAATAWPDEFYISFESNITYPSVSTPVVPVAGVAYYDWTIKSQRIEHGAGAYECVEFYDTQLPCTEFFLPDGLYRVLQLPLPQGQTEECCLDMAGIGASPPDWASATNPTYNGQVASSHPRLCFIINPFILITFELDQY